MWLQNNLGGPGGCSAGAQGHGGCFLSKGQLVPLQLKLPAWFCSVSGCPKKLASFPPSGQSRLPRFLPVASQGSEGRAQPLVALPAGQDVLQSLPAFLLHTSLVFFPSTSCQRDLCGQLAGLGDAELPGQSRKHRQAALGTAPPPPLRGQGGGGKEVFVSHILCFNCNGVDKKPPSAPSLWLRLRGSPQAGTPRAVRRRRVSLSLGPSPLPQATFSAPPDGKGFNCGNFAGSPGIKRLSPA